MFKDSSAVPSVLFHVGYHKTATTWMQRQFFQKRFGFHDVLSLDQVSELITDPLPFDFDAARAGEVLEAQCNRTGLANVVSNETLCGHPFYGGRDGPVFAERIHAIAPNARILLTIREQKKAITSTYMQYLSRAGSLPPAEFFEKSSEKYGYYYFNKRHFLYDRLVKHYIDLFGEGRVLVVSLESFVKDPGRVLGSIAQFAGADQSAVSSAPSRRVGESPVEAVAPILRRINHFRTGAAKREAVVDLGRFGNFLYRSVGRIGRGRIAKSRLGDVSPVSSVVRARFEGCFGESNRRLQALLGSMIDLAGDNFEMGGSGRPDLRRTSTVAGDGPVGPGRAHEAVAGD